MNRSATSHSCRNFIRTPTPIEEVQQRKRILLSRNVSRNPQKSQTNFNKQISTPFRQTGVTFTRPNLIQRVRTSKQQNKGFLSQNFNQQNSDKQNMPYRHSIPIRMLRMAKLCQQKSDEAPIYVNQFAQKSNRKQFLRKGTSVNRSIMFNVLKSKCNKNTVDSAYSYTNHPQNRALSAAIYDQVPRGLRDIIGPEQMLRMSNIFTGGTISAINLHRKVNQIVNKYHEKKQHNNVQQDQAMTLKSIKRW